MAAAPPARRGPAAGAAIALSLRQPLPRALLVLTFTTGLVDAASFLGLGRVFTANMTGNVVLLGFALAGAGGLPLVAPLISLGAFLAGSGYGGALARRLGADHSRHVERALLIEAALIAIAAVLAAIVDIDTDGLSGYGVIALLGLAMGVRNATARHIGAPDLTTTVLTGTLVGLAAESTPAGGSGEGTARRLAAIGAMLSGAVAGALLVKVSLFVPLACAAGLALLTWLVYVPAAAKDGSNGS